MKKDYASPELCQKLVELGIVVPETWDAWWAQEEHYHFSRQRWEIINPHLTYPDDMYDNQPIDLYGDKYTNRLPAFSGTCLGWVLDKLKTAAIPSWGRSWTHEAEPDDRANYLTCVIDTQEDNIDRINQLLQEWVQ